MNNKKLLLLLNFGIVMLFACRKSEFLDKKPSSSISTPVTLTDFQYILDNTVVMNVTGGLGQLSADEYVLSDADWSTGSATERNAYIWSKDPYGGDVGIADWNKLYTEVFYCNSVLDKLAKSDSINTAQGQFIKGWALFDRAYCNYDLIRNFCKAYNNSTASSDLGIPLRLTSGIDKLQQRATLEQSFSQVFTDLAAAVNSLPSARPSNNLNRPFKTAVYALLARIFLDMRNYQMAETNVDLALNSYNTLIDYNTVDQNQSTPFSTTNDELIFNTSQVVAYGDFTPVGDFPGIAKIPPTLINLYSSNDLRLSIFFGKFPDNTYYKKAGYNGVNGYPFTGLATDELYLIKSECLAREGQASQAMDMLNKLLINRFKTGTFVPLASTSASDALNKVMLERQKELIWRETRWADLKRLNVDGANITLTRTVNGQIYSLPANDNRWVFPIPADEIAISGIQQNPR
ncbi:SusD family protein [Mucilaginibacter gossypiicola]|uniref:SusD family protein n=1 Tax=Mucilaginibacter gossypiicola TaxID=551995 RepID=A0A1H8DMD0_9SPHI|nr:RagB/SusD family nutrient uptake outer membrane protein [Mucilaginibacter gossypiicola]SEN08393.1 SusD family protein [Mucilaginibacter gossypiicola]